MWSSRDPVMILTERCRAAFANCKVLPPQDIRFAILKVEAER